MKRYLAIAAVLAATSACKKKEAKNTPAAATADAATAAPSTPVDAGAKPEAPSVIEVKGFETPESVLHDQENDVYLVSNIVGNAPEKDGKGHISRVQPDGTVELKWIEGGRDGVELDAPKGLAIVGDMFYVADIDVVRIFERKTGKPSGQIEVPGATFLNDLAAADGMLWLSDTGIKFDASGPQPTHTDAIYLIDPTAKTVKKVISGDELGHPNGLTGISDTEVRVVTFGTGEIYRVSVDGDTGKRDEIVKAPKGMLDGVVELPDSKLLVSSWEAKTVFKVDEDGVFAELVTGVESPADIGFDARRRRVLIPLFMQNVVQIHPVP